MTTQQGNFVADSPFLRRAWTWGADGLSVDQSRNAKTTVVAKRQRAKVSISQANSGAPTRTYSFA